MGKIQYFQEGGGMPQDPSMQQPRGGGDPTAQLQQMVQQYAQTQDPQLAVAIADTLVQAMGLGGGQGAPAPQSGQPAYAKGGTLPKGKSAIEKLKEARGL
jgi:hypothetical protein